MTLNAFRFITLFASLTFIPLGYFVYAKQSASRLNQLLFAFMLTCALWSFGFFLTMFPEMPYRAALWSSRISHSFGGWPAILFLEFVVQFLKPEYQHRVHPLHRIVAAGAVLSPLTPWMIPTVVAKRCFPYYPEPGALYPFLLATYFGTFSYAFWLLGKAYLNRALGSVRRRQILLMFLGVFLPWINVATLFLLIYNVQVTPVMIFFPVMVPFFSFSIIRYQFLDLRIVITKSLVYSLLIACITAAYLVMVMVMERWFQGFMGYRSIVATVVVAFVIAMCFNPLRDWIQTFVDRALFKATAPEMAVQREQLLTELRKSDQMKAVATLAAGLAHEIKNPLSAIKTFTEFLPERYQEPGFLEKFHRIVGQEVEKIHATVQNLLAFAKPQAIKRERLALAPLVQDMVTLLAGDCLKRQVQVEEAVPAELYVLGDRTQLKQVLLNLCLNSLEAMDGSGGLLRIAATQQDGQVLLTVHDTGPGIAPEALSKVFDPFFTTKATGTGLGLSVVQGIIQEHGGRISLTSQVGQGTTVTVRLPVADGEEIGR